VLQGGARSDQLQNRAGRGKKARTRGRLFDKGTGPRETGHVIRMVRSLYERFRLWWRARRVKRRAASLDRGEIEIPLLPFIVPRRLSVDVGANKGALTYILAELSERVVAYEANPNLAARLAQACGPTVDLRHKAVSNSNGTLTFFVPTSGGEEQPNIGSLKANEAYATREYKVEAVRLDDENLAGVGFIKVDVEGTELDVLEGARGIITRDRPVLMVEINDKNTPEATAIESLMKAHGYAIVDFSNKTIEVVDTVRQVANRNVIFLPRRQA
jgi:FkbM family methyltransferase